MRGEETQAVPHRPDESMSLLTDLYRSAVDDEYHQLAARRHATPDLRASHVGAPMRVTTLLRQPAVLLGTGVLLIGMLLATTVVEQRRDAPALAAERVSLVERIEALTAQTNALRDDLAAAQLELSTTQDRALQASVEGEQVSDRLDALSAIGGTTALTGPGLVVTVDDAPPGTADDPDATGDGMVQDIDLQQLVNGLWEAGAEAIAVDGVRVGARSAVRAAGDAMFMDLQPLSPPYVVTAIGDPAHLGARFLDTYGADWLQVLASAYGIEYKVEAEDSVTVPPGTGGDLRWAAATGADAGSSDDASDDATSTQETASSDTTATSDSPDPDGEQTP